MLLVFFLYCSLLKGMCTNESNFSLKFTSNFTCASVTNTKKKRKKQEKYSVLTQQDHKIWGQYLNCIWWVLLSQTWFKYYQRLSQVLRYCTFHNLFCHVDVCLLFVKKIITSHWPNSNKSSSGKCEMWVK